MKFLAQIVPALFVVSSLVQASAVISRTNDDDFLPGFLDALRKNNLTILAENYENYAETKEGKPVIEALKYGKTTLLAPEDRAFDKDNTKIDPNVLLFSTLPGSIDDNFSSDRTTITRRNAISQSQSIVRTSFRRPSYVSSGRKRQNASGIQNTLVNKLSGSNPPRKRWNNDIILIDQPVGHAKVVGRFAYKDIIVLVIDSLTSLPGKGSDLFSQPLIEDASFNKFGGALKKACLDDLIDSKDQLTIFAPVDESLDKIDKLSKDDLTCFLENHFLFGKIVYTPLFPSVQKATAQSGKELKFSYKNDIHYVSCGKSKAVVLRGDVITANGVLHIIDRPLKCN